MQQCNPWHCMQHSAAHRLRAKFRPSSRGDEANEVTWSLCRQTVRLTVASPRSLLEQKQYWTREGECMCVCLCAYGCICACVYVPMGVCVCFMSVHVSVPMRVRKSLHMCVCVCLCLYVCKYVGVCVSVSVCACIVCVCDCGCVSCVSLNIPLCLSDSCMGRERKQGMTRSRRS